MHESTRLPEVGFSSEIGEARERAEAELRQQWRTFDTVLSHTEDFNYTFDLEGRFTYVNRALLALWNKPLAEAVGKNFFDLGYPPELAARLQSQIQKVILSRQPLRDTTPYTGAAGETGYYEYIFVPVLGENEHVEAVAGSTRDITPHHRLTLALADSEDRLRRVFAQAPVAIAVFRGRDFVIELANAHFQVLHQGQELAGRPYREVMPEAHAEVWDVFRRVLDTGEPFVANEWLIPYDFKNNGSLEDHWFNAAYHPIRGLDGSVSGFIAVLVDVTPQVLARKEQERINSQLEEFAYVASHDLQEPLRMVSIYTQLLVRRYASQEPQAQQYAEIISQGAKRMETLIRDLLTYLQTVQHSEADLGVADLSETLEDALAVLKERIEETGAKIRTAPLPLVRGDRVQLSLVFQNILSNALKYSKAGLAPEISISAAREDGLWMVSVKDQGIGFEPEHAERIFGLFKRLHNSADYPGTGLGLAICQRIVERCGGRMWAQSALGKGSTFYFTLPPGKAE